uniref:Uncharacterized protein n=1 Tax=Histophilus somni (strain 129Pt) TaxID=205914 RepID=Q0I427_HISS1
MLYYNTLLFKDFKQDRDLINSTEMRGLYADIDQKSWRELTHWRRYFYHNIKYTWQSSKNRC